MAKPFSETVNIQPQTVATGQPQALMTLSQKLDDFSSFTAQKVAAKQVEEATIKGQQAGIAQQQAGGPLELKEETFIGGISKKAFNQAAREGYVKSLENDIRENVNSIALNNKDNLLGFNTEIDAFAKGVLEGADPSIRSAVELSIDSKISQARPQIEAQEAKKIERIANEENAAAADGARIDAIDAAYDGNGDAAAHAMAVATDSITQRTDIDQDRKQQMLRQLNTEVKEAQLAKSIDTVYDSEGGGSATKMLDDLKKPAGMELSDWNSFISSQRANINRKDARKKAQAQVDLNEAKTKLRQYQTAKSLGFEVDSSEEAVLSGLVAGTPLEKQKQIIDDTAQFSVMSYDDRRSVLASGETGQLADVDAYASILKADQEINKAAMEDGYSLGVRQGIIPSTPLDIGDPDSFQARLEQAELLTSHYGVDVSPLSDGEAAGLSQSIPDMTPDEKIALATTLQSAPEVWGQLDKNNAGQFAMAGASGDMAVMTAIFKGQELLKEKLVKPLRQDDYLSFYNDIVEGVYGPDDRRAVLDAVISHYSSTSSSAIAGFYDSADFARSVMAVTGGIGSVNGYNIELPRGVDEDSFEDFIDDLQPETIEGMGGIANYSSAGAVEAIQQGRIRSNGSNQYYVETDGGTLFGKDGKPFIFSYSLDTATTNSAIARSKRYKTRRKLMEANE